MLYRFGMTPAEKRIWEAAYAAAFVRYHADEEHLRHQLGKGSYNDVGDNVEKAMTTADKAVEAIRKWRKQEGDSFYEYLPEMDKP